MANIFTQAAKLKTTLSPVMVNREKMTTQDLIRDFPDFVTVDEFDILTTKNEETGDMDTFAVFAFKEDPSKYVFGGTVMTQVCETWVGLFDGEIEKASAAIKESGGCKIRFYRSRTNKGRNITLLEVLDD